MPAALRRPALVLLALLALAASYVAVTADNAGASVRRVGPGVTLISSPILLGPGDALTGEGSGQSILRAAAGYTGTLVANANMDGVNPNNRVQGVTLDCAGTADGALDLTGNDRLHIEDVEATGCIGRWGIQVRNILGGTLLTHQTWRDIYAHHNRQGGVTNGHRTRGAIYQGITASYNGGTGFRMDGSEALVMGVAAHRNGGAGVISNNVISSTFVGVRAVGNDVGLLIYDSPRCVFDGVQAQNNRSIDVHVDNTYRGTFSYGDTVQTIISGTAGPVPHTMSGAEPPANSRALVVDRGQQVETSDLLITTG